MAIKKGHRFEVPFEVAFPRGLVLLGEIAPDTQYEPDRTKPKVQKKDVDERTGEVFTGLRQWKATVTDPDEDRAKRASFEVIFLSEQQPVPTSGEVVPGTGMRMVELEGLTAEPKVMGQGEFRYQGFQYRATGIKGDRQTPKSSSKAAVDPKAGA